ncbi:MAG: hypothetical protein IK099_12680 [Clostridia bacterium]|nr:hypothetical protein [Clostridia bacterium]
MKSNIIIIVYGGRNCDFQGFQDEEFKISACAPVLLLHADGGFARRPERKLCAGGINRGGIESGRDSHFGRS